MALVWTAYAHLRGRPLPGSASAVASGAFLGAAIDLRSNTGLVPTSYLGNAVWMLQISSSERKNWLAKESQLSSSSDPSRARFVTALSEAAVSIRQAVLGVREQPRILLQACLATARAPSMLTNLNIVGRLVREGHVAMPMLLQGVQHPAVTAAGLLRLSAWGIHQWHPYPKPLTRLQRIRR